MRGNLSSERAPPAEGCHVFCSVAFHFPNTSGPWFCSVQLDAVLVAYSWLAPTSHQLPLCPLGTTHLVSSNLFFSARSGRNGNRHGAMTSFMCAPHIFKRGKWPTARSRLRLGLDHGFDWFRDAAARSRAYASGGSNTQTNELNINVVIQFCHTETDHSRRQVKSAGQTPARKAHHSLHECKRRGRSKPSR